ncbi:MAG: hypothetical protein V4506_09570 [Bacteroidota bacterium]
MKKLSFLYISLLSTGLSYAQDMITKTDSSKVSAVIIEINSSDVKYKLSNYTDGPTRVCSKTDIAYIVFKNGELEKFPPQTPVDFPGYNPNKYNLDNVPVETYNSRKRIKKCEILYKHKNYLGFNYIAFLNTALGFNYMRDIKKANLIINVPFAFGLGSPSITNGLYGRQYLDNNSTTKYNLMRYQVGISPLFTPAMNSEMNFLMGPSLTFIDYNMKVNTRYRLPGNSQYPYNSATFTNTFELYRLHYGVNVGFMARFSERINMNMLLTVGFKHDTYNKKDPYGFEVTNGSTEYDAAIPDNVMPYVNFAWSIGYRF